MVFTSVLGSMIINSVHEVAGDKMFQDRYICNPRILSTQLSCRETGAVPLCVFAEQNVRMLSMRLQCKQDTLCCMAKVTLSVCVLRVQSYIIGEWANNYPALTQLALGATNLSGGLLMSKKHCFWTVLGTCCWGSAQWKTYPQAVMWGFWLRLGSILGQGDEPRFLGAMVEHSGNHFRTDPPLGG